jgi:hypothetical protein
VKRWSRLKPATYAALAAPRFSGPAGAGGRDPVTTPIKLYLPRPQQITSLQLKLPLSLWNTEIGEGNSKEGRAFYISEHRQNTLPNPQATDSKEKSSGPSHSCKPVLPGQQLAPPPASPKTTDTPHFQQLTSHSPNFFQKPPKICLKHLPTSSWVANLQESR